MEAEEEEEDKKKKGTLAAGVSRPKTNPGCLLFLEMACLSGESERK